MCTHNAFSLPCSASSNALQGIYVECASVLYDEIDYINEGRNADRFRRNFRDTPWVRTPVVHWEFSSPRVLTLEYLPGAHTGVDFELSSLPG
jgi:predicted unusual protein kinase regulating ubiquinone biosynthesis (AarF/ABC1/UbiB family)